MTKKILIIFALIAAFNFTPMLQSEVSARIELSEIDNQQVKIEQDGNAIIVSGAMGKVVNIYNLIGTIVCSIRIDSNEKRIELSNLPKGIYPIKVGKVAKKIHIAGR